VIKYQKVPDIILFRNASLLNATSLQHQQVIQELKNRFYSSVKSDDVVNVVDDAKHTKESKIQFDSDEEQDSYRIQQENVDASQRTFDIKNLEEWTSYRITVTAATKIGVGPSSSPLLIVRTDESGMSLVFIIIFVGFILLMSRCICFDLFVFSCLLAIDYVNSSRARHTEICPSHCCRCSRSRCCSRSRGLISFSFLGFQFVSFILRFFSFISHKNARVFLANMHAWFKQTACLAIVFQSKSSHVFFYNRSRRRH